MTSGEELPRRSIHAVFCGGSPGGYIHPNPPIIACFAQLHQGIATDWPIAICSSSGRYRTGHRAQLSKLCNRSGWRFRLAGNSCRITRGRRGLHITANINKCFPLNIVRMLFCFRERQYWRKTNVGAFHQRTPFIA